MTNLASFLTAHPATDDEDLLHTVTQTMTAGTARRDAHAFARSLRAAGIGAGQAVAVQLPNGLEAITAMVGTWLADAVYVPVNPRHPQAEVEKIVVATEPAALVDGGGLHSRGTGRRYPDDAAFVLWTSGTTGAPKPVLHTHAAYVEIIDRVLGPLRGGDGSRKPAPNLIPVPLALNAGIYNTLFGLRAGAEIVVMDRFDPRQFAALVRRFGIRSTVLPPAALAALADDPAVVDLTPLKYVRSITAPLTPRQATRFAAKFDVFVLNGYGQAEIGEVIGWTAADAKAHPEKVGAIGRPHPGVDIKVVTDAGRQVAAGDTGRLLVRPPNRAVGYASGGQLADRIDAEGFVDTGDLARVDADGFVWIEGRASDVINRGGNKVVPDEVEEVLRAAPGVTDAAVVGVPDERLGEVPVAFIVGRATAADLELHCRSHLAAYKVPVRFHAVEELPRTEMGKLRRAELIALVAP